MLFKETEDGCIICTSHTLDKDGYVVIRDPRYKEKGRAPSVKYHRYVWELAHGEIPEGYDIHHICHNQSCCNVDHLMCIKRGEHARTHNSEKYNKDYDKLEGAAKEYWLQHDVGTYKLAELFGVTAKTTRRWICKWKQEVEY